MNRRGETYGGTIKEVVAYEDDVHVWVYLDQVDKVIRYEAYVVGYDDRGQPGTLDFVLEEGVLDNVHEVPVVWDLLQHNTVAYHQTPHVYHFTVDGRLITAPSLIGFYMELSSRQLATIHEYFATQETELKKSRRRRWTRALTALGYDVIASL